MNILLGAALSSTRLFMPELWSQIQIDLVAPKMPCLSVGFRYSNLSVIL